MRAFEGQFSDNQPIKRSVPEKQKQLRELREDAGGDEAAYRPDPARERASADRRTPG